ncbi:MAG: hypothetical protein ABFD54_01120 [Armatimonadota bacterium]|nr:hypothetical protein [bacterium]
MRTELSYDNAIYWANQQHELLQQQATLEVRITALEHELDRIEKDILGDITSEKDETGKARYGNEQARKAEVSRRLALDPHYQRESAEMTILTKESMHLQREAKYAGKIVEIMCTFAQKEQEPLIPVPASVLASIGKPRKETVQVPSIEDLSADEEEFPAA